MSLSVIQRILLGFGILLLLLLTLAASGFSGIQKIENRLNVVTGDVANISASSSRLREVLSSANASVLQYLLSNSPDALVSLEEKFQSQQAGYSEIHKQLETQLQPLPEMEGVLNSINTEAVNFFEYTKVAFANHKLGLELTSAIVNEKLDLKDSVSFAVEDLTLLEEDGDNSEIKFAASYMRSQMESLQVSVSDYFDLHNLEDMASLREDMAATISGIKDKQAYVKDDSINDLVHEVEIGTTADEGVIAKYYENLRLSQESEALAEQLSDSMEKLNGFTKTLLIEASTMRAKAKVEANDAATLSIYIMSIVLVISVLIAVLVALWVSRSIRLPLKEVMNVLGKISEGDFTQRSKVKTKDEFGELSRWVNDLVAKLQGVLVEIERASNNVAESAQSNVRLAGESKRLMGAQNDKTTGVASAMTEMAATVHQVAKSSEITLHQIQQVDQSATQNRSSMDQNIQKIEGLVEQIEESTRVVNQLDEHSKDIGRILEVIQGIAEQTNLLALNAAIEAARAGEQGRGFAVVADEVRTLATRTHSSTEEIQNVIVQLQAGVSKTVESMEVSRKSAHSSVDEAHAVGESLAELQEHMVEIRDLSTQIATAAEQQSAVANEISQNVLEISSMSDQASLGADQSEKDSSGLSELASHQKHLLSQFKTA
ncbi:methyl-accepting chemotaxis protein [Marinomonas transparens]|uniref:Methyl-accepting chemotaxis protein n=1 Tax=Marinomonas transparens TaxID=2795388 RepID=A0A934JSJ8_9GAMM|nr:methyl-accepting chemotaxis protein [Marinomonas transparens]MBJ7539219.1 methyl-accepting chemotaxis protein [Marinomonas transparens]